MDYTSLTEAQKIFHLEAYSKAIHALRNRVFALQMKLELLEARKLEVKIAS